MTEKEVTALKAVLYLATHNSRLRHGGTYVENMHDYENCAKIPFMEAVRIVDAMLYGTAKEDEKMKGENENA